MDVASPADAARVVQHVNVKQKADNCDIAPVLYFANSQPEEAFCVSESARRVLRNNYFSTIEYVVRNTLLARRCEHTVWRSANFQLQLSPKFSSNAVVERGEGKIAMLKRRLTKCTARRR
ncbi:hypothetical protein M514_04850 [Trichuris suis]|uniref:Uncharacterized protein n=1 Tax=Trichuris suis TaxID=68888 RepID=A0A085NUJ1_9BILA|nr:hypothetical protein M513_04850 [Trichuris suis]KFD73137.1 hypothetical protein M514_04850 [Trichuris suis]